MRCQRDDAAGSAVGSTEADGEEVVVVVDQFEGGRETLAEGSAAGADLFGYGGIEFCDEGRELLGGRFFRDGLRCFLHGELRAGYSTRFYVCGERQ